MNATPKQLFRLYSDTGRCLELREMNLPFNTASEMISRLVDGISPDVIYNELIELGATPKGTKIPRKPKQDFQAIYDEAHQAGIDAAQSHKPMPMFVEQHANPLDDSSPVLKSWKVSGGVCGFAWIKFKGNTAWAKWTQKNKLSRKSYPNGLQIWVDSFGQSMEMKEKYAYAFAKVLQKHGIKAYAESRMD